MWEWEQGPFWIVRSKLCLIRNLAQTCKAFSEVYRGDLRNIALNWLQRVLSNRYRDKQTRVPGGLRPSLTERSRRRLIATRKSFPDYRAVLKGRDFVSQVLPLEDSSSEYLDTSASESDTERDVSLPDDSSEPSEVRDGTCFYEPMYDALDYCGYVDDEDF